MLMINRSSRSEVFSRKTFLENFAKFTGKHVCRSIFLSKVAGWRTYWGTYANSCFSIKTSINKRDFSSFIDFEQIFDFILVTQQTFTWSKSTIETVESLLFFFFKVYNNVSDVILVSLLVTLNIFYTILFLLLTLSMYLFFDIHYFSWELIGYIFKNGFSKGLKLIWINN